MLTFNFEKARATLFTAGYSQLQVNSINSIIAEFNAQANGTSDQRADFLAYMLATGYHEAYDWNLGPKGRLIPIAEKGTLKYLKSLPYYPFIGRGFVQLTWNYNYTKYRADIQERFGFDIMKQPDKLLEVDVAAYVIVNGMLKGRYTGKKLADYVDKKGFDFIQARRIVNGVKKGDTARDAKGVLLADKAKLIGAYFVNFLECVENVHKSNV